MLILSRILLYLVWLFFYLITCFFLWFVSIKYIIGLEINANIFSIYIDFLKTNIIFLLLAALLSHSWWNKKYKA